MPGAGLTVVSDCREATTATAPAFCFSEAEGTVSGRVVSGSLPCLWRQEADPGKKQSTCVRDGACVLASILPELRTRG